MEQPSIACFFNNRKRVATDDLQYHVQAKKAFLLDSPSSKLQEKLQALESDIDESKVTEDNVTVLKRKIATVAPLNSRLTPKTGSNKKVKTRKTAIKPKNNMDIKQLLNSVRNQESTPAVAEKQNQEVTPPCSPRTPPRNIMDNIKMDGPSLKELKNKMRRSVRLSELKASLSRIEACEKKLEKIEENTSQITDSPKLKEFRTIELEIQTTPKKEFPPDQAYLSPKKTGSSSGVRRNLLHSLTPTKLGVSVSSTISRQLFPEAERKELSLPYKYRFLVEIFRAIDTVVQMLYNRKDLITFNKVKPAVEEMLKRTLTENRLAQIKTIYPEAFEFSQKKIKDLNTEKWELIIKPLINEESITSEILLNRRRILYNRLLDKTKDYHNEFLMNLDKPVKIAKDKIMSWHSEFDLEKVPDIPMSPMPKAPNEDKITSGIELFEKTKELFSCNSRVGRALEKLKEKKTTENNIEENSIKSTLPESALKGIPKAVLEKVREKQAAKALLSITRSSEQEKELRMYSRLSELAKLSRNVFVAEKRGVLQLETLIGKLLNCYRGNLSKVEMETHLKVISKELPKWMEFTEIRKCVYVKLDKNADLNMIRRKLEGIFDKKKNEG